MSTGDPQSDGMSMDALLAALAAHLESGPHVEAGFGFDGRLLFLNAAGRNLLGLPAGALPPSLTLESLLGPGASGRIRKEVRERGSWSGEAALFTPKVERIPVWMAARAHPEEQGHPAFLGLTAIDGSRRRDAAGGQLETEGRYRSLIAAMAEGVVLQDRQGTILECNGAAESMLGLSRDQMAGRTSLDPRWKAVHEDGTPFPGDMHPAMVTLRTGRACMDVVMGVRKPDGALTWISINTQPVRRAEGAELLGVVCTFTDITPRKEAEQARLHLESRFLQAQKMESVGRLAGGIAHDFNNLLTPILGYAELAAARASADPALADMISHITEAARSARDLTRQLLAFGRKQVLELSPIGLHRFLREFEGLLRRIIGEDVRVELRLGPEEIRVRADPVQIQQILMNLAVNARDAMPRGGRLGLSSFVALLEGAAARAAELSPGRYAVVEVEDSGPGMPPEILSRIFEPFFTTKEKGKGTGLGLATAYGIAKQHGGHLAVRSESGRGACFSLYLPLSTQELRPLPELPEGLPGQAAAVGGRESILLVEDDPAVRRLVLHVLSSQGYRVREAESGLQALQMLPALGESIDLLLTDVIMPGLDGRELYRRLHADFPSMKVLFMSGYAHDVLSGGAAGDPSLPLIRKPFDLGDLGRKVRAVLDGGSASSTVIRVAT